MEYNVIDVDELYNKRGAKNTWLRGGCYCLDPKPDLGNASGGKYLY